MYKDFRQAVIHLLTDDPELTKYRLAKELGMSTPTILNNVLTSATKRPHYKFIVNLYNRYNIKLEGETYEDIESTGNVNNPVE